MLKKAGVMALVLFGVVFVPVSFAFQKPLAPAPPSSSSSLEIPAPPDISGVYDVPERPGMKVKVFSHPAKPAPPSKPGSPNPSPSPSTTVSDLLTCGLIDPDSASITGPAGWRIPAGNWIYQLNPGSVPSSVGSNNLDTIVKSALIDQYAPATGDKIHFVRGADTSVNRARLDGKNIISWGNASNGTLGVTYAWYYPSTGLVVEEDTIMNNRYKWSWSNSLTCADNKTYDAQDILTHELGHWLGLTDEYNASIFSDNTMYGYGSTGEVKKTTLTAGDIAGVKAIYP